MIKIILIHDNSDDCEKITSVISGHNDLVIQYSGKDCYDAIHLVTKHKPDIALIGITPEGMGISGVLKRNSPETRVVYLCSCVKDSLIQEIVKEGVRDYLLRENDINSLDSILRSIHNGEHYINSGISARAIQILADHCKTGVKKMYTEKTDFSPADFSRTELKIFRLIADGYCGREIAQFLNFNEGTVRNYTSSIIKKTKLKNRSQVILYARECGLCSSKIKAG